MRPDEPTVGQLRRQVMLGTEAVYRICAFRDDLVEVEVVRAPGLETGLKFSFTRDAVGAMEPVSDVESSA
jgi:hypothetical protein